MTAYSERFETWVNVTALPKTEQDEPLWQTAAHELMIMAAARDRIVMLAEIAMRQTLDHSALFRVG